MKKEEGYKKLREIIEDNIFHEDYKRVTELADKYYKMVSGDGIEELLHRITTRTTDDEWDQVKRIYRSIIPSTIGSTKLPFKKALRKQPAVRDIEYDKQADKKRDELEKFIGKYWGDKSLEEYLEYAFIDYNYLDPNAFLITEFNDFDPNKEKASPYPFVADSKEAIMFEYDNEILQYLVIRLDIEFMDRDLKRKGYKYVMYMGMDTIVFTEVAKLTDRPKKATEVIEIKEKYFAVFYYQPKNEKVPAMRFGYSRDAQTKGRTFVSIFNNVVGFLEKTLKIDSELDLSTAMTAFPQRFQYVTACTNQGCNKGRMLDDTECPVCGGTGIQPHHRSVADVITLALPKNADPSQLLNLDNLLVYKYPPIDLLKFQSDYLEYLKTTAYELMFNVDRFTRSQVSKTATEAVIESDNLNDTLFDFGRAYSAMFEYVVMDIATFTDNADTLMVHHKFPYDFKIKGLRELMADLQTAKEAGASAPSIAAIEDDINEILYSDRPEDLKEIRIKNDINPFRGNSPENIRFIISQGNTTLYNRTLWENMEAIFEELELENEDPWLYDMAFDKINEKVKAKTEEYIQRIKDEKNAEYDEYMKKQAGLRPQGSTGTEAGQTGIEEGGTE